MRSWTRVVVVVAVLALVAAVASAQTPQRATQQQQLTKKPVAVSESAKTALRAIGTVQGKVLWPTSGQPTPANASACAAVQVYLNRPKTVPPPAGGGGLGLTTTQYEEVAQGSVSAVDPNDWKKGCKYTLKAGAENGLALSARYVGPWPNIGSGNVSAQVTNVNVLKGTTITVNIQLLANKLM
jgi:hypothetical protein